MVDKLLQLYHIGIIGTDIEAIIENNLHRKTVEQIAKQFLLGKMFLVKGKRFTLDTVKEIHIWETEGVEILSNEQAEAMKSTLQGWKILLPPVASPLGEKSGIGGFPREWAAILRLGRDVTTEIFAQVNESQVSSIQEEEEDEEENASKPSSNKAKHNSGRNAYIVGDGNILLNIDDNGLIVYDSYNSIVDKIKDQVELELQQKVLKILEEIKNALKEKDVEKAKWRWKKLKDCSAKAADIAMPWISPALKAISSHS